MTIERRPRFISLIGYPGVGKSTYANTLREQGIIVISGDEVIREAMQRYGLSTMDVAWKEHREEINAIMKKRIDDAIIAGQDIAIDAFNTSRGRRQYNFVDIKSSGHNYRCEAIVFHPPEEEEHARRLVHRIIFEGRSEAADGLFLHRLERHYEPPTVDEGFEVISEVGSPPKKPMMRM